MSWLIIAVEWILGVAKVAISSLKDDPKSLP